MPKVSDSNSVEIDDTYGLVHDIPIIVQGSAQRIDEVGKVFGLQEYSLEFRIGLAHGEQIFSLDCTDSVDADRDALLVSTTCP